MTLLVGWFGGSAKKGLCVLDFFCWGLLSRVIFFAEIGLVGRNASDANMELESKSDWLDATQAMQIWNLSRLLPRSASRRSASPRVAICQTIA